MKQHIKLSHMYTETINEEREEANKKRKEERGRRRFEDDFDFLNEEFYNDWQTRTKRGRAA